MRIAIGGILSKPITPHPLGGTEAFTYTLIDELVKMGHDVTLYCSKGSKTPAQRHVPIVDKDTAMDTISNLHLVYPYTLLQTHRMIKDINQNNYDLVHINFLKTFMFSYFAGSLPVPVVYTIHRDFMQHKEIFDVYRRIGFHKNEHYVFVSNFAKKLSLLKPRTHVVHNGIRLNQFPTTTKNERNFFFWMSRIDPLKGPQDAVRAAKRANAPLLLSGIIDRPKYQEYFDTMVKPYIGGAISYEKPASIARKRKLYQEAAAFVFPIHWEEPFGLVLAEAMASGTPVIAYARGAIPEIVEDGVTGFVINPSEKDKRGSWKIKKTGIAGIAEAMQTVQSLSESDYRAMRKKSRQRIETYFSSTRMAQGYEALYKSLLGKRN